jgi:hypothetical protein
MCCGKARYALRQDKQASFFNTGEGSCPLPPVICS